jgi:hypothetical protein
MEPLAVLVALACYGLAIYLWWSQKRPVFFVALLGGHLSALAAPLWSLLYDATYPANLETLFSVFDQPISTAQFMAAAWFYPLPALLVIYLYYIHWWFAGYFTALLTYAAFLFYHTILESIGLRLGLWSYSGAAALPLGISHALLSTIMAALISLALLYVLLLAHRSSLPGMLLVLLPAPLLLNLLVRGLLGAPLWVAQWITDPAWIITIGTLSTLGLLVWAIHIVARGLSLIEKESDFT